MLSQSNNINRKIQLQGENEMQIFTLGYEGIDVASFIKILIQNDIET
jgi:hypothetical protein